MKNKKGFTVVELIVSFSLAMAIAVFLFQIVMLVKNMYVDNGIKTQLLNKQSIITNQINEKFNTKNVYAVSKCGSYCLNFVYTDGDADQLIIDKNNNSIQFGNYKTTLVTDSYFGDMNIDVNLSPVFDENQKDGILSIDIPIYNDALKGENYGVNVIYQFRSSSTNITNIVFDEEDTSNGYIILKGGNSLTQYDDVAYNEHGFIAYDKDGNIIDNSNVRITNPLSSQSVPYKLGTYEITYELLDSNGNPGYKVSRFVKINEYFKLNYTGATTIHTDLNASFTAPACQLVSSGGRVVTANQLPRDYSYSETGSVDTSTLGAYTLSCKLLQNGSIIKQYNRTVYVEKEYKINLNYSGSIKELTLPATTTYTIELYGAQGGSGIYNSYIGVGGKGGYSKATYSGSKNGLLYFIIGGKGTDGNSSSNYAGGFNGGGKGYYYSGGGGGATEVRRPNGSYMGGYSTGYRILIAGGGGGGTAYNGSSYIAAGGAGGGANKAGSNGTYHSNWNVNKPGLGGKIGSYNTTGMNSQSYNYGMTLGSILFGGNAYSPNGSPYSYSGGGGGGYYGGTSGGANGTSGGGGSGYANSSYMKNATGTNGVNEGNGKAVITFKYHGELENYQVRDLPVTEFHYTGGSQSYSVATTANYFIETWGAQGGNANYGNNTSYSMVQGGRGGYTAGTRSLSSGTTLYVYVGGNGTLGYSSTSYAGGYNGGGTGYYYSGGGGGATHVSTTNNTLNNLSGSTSTIYAVAGGGGGASSYTTYAAVGGYGGGGRSSGGYGGYHTGANSSNSSSYRGAPGTISASPTTGMYSTSYNNTTYLGTFGKGGGSTVYTYTGGGGAGYYGGAQGGYSGSAGGGGSGYYNGLSGVTSGTGVKQGNGEARIVCMTCNAKQTISFNQVEFAYTDTVQEYIIPKTGKYKLEVWGASGGNYNSNNGGKGGYSVGIITLSENSKLFIRTGGAGTTSTESKLIPGGTNGGGSTYGQGTSYVASSGGGASDIRINEDSLYSRVIVAGGGGGAGYYNSVYSSGGAGGGINGIAGTKAGYANYGPGTGGTQITGGTKGNNSSHSNNGTFGNGGNQTGSSGGWNGCGGGGGWYGGGSGGALGDGGGGGSGWVYTASTFNTWQSGNSADAAKYTLNSSYYLTDASTVAGNTSFTDPNGTVVTGHSGDGHARITYLGP